MATGPPDPPNDAPSLAPAISAARAKLAEPELPGVALTRQQLMDEATRQARRELAERASRMGAAEVQARIEAAAAQRTLAAATVTSTAVAAALPSHAAAAAAGLPVTKLSRPNDKIQQADLRSVRNEVDVEGWKQRMKAKVEELRVLGDVLPKNLKRVLNHIAELVEASGKGGAQRALSTIADSIELGVRTVQKALAFAVEHGLLIVMNVPKWEDRDLRLQANLYLLNGAYKDVVVPEPAGPSDRTTWRQRYVAKLLGLFARPGDDKRPGGVNTSPLRAAAGVVGTLRAAET